MHNHKNFLAVQYGTIVMLRGICDCCGEESFIDSEGLSTCCRSSVICENRTKTVKETEGIYKRKQPSLISKKAILENQDNRCYWCGREFNQYVISPSGKTIRQLTIEWDHYIPYDYTGSCEDKEFVAACIICNRYKSSMFIIDEEIAKKTIIQKWIKSGWRAL